jgi:hypothetical protein
LVCRMTSTSSIPNINTNDQYSVPEIDDVERFKEGVAKKTEIHKQKEKVEGNPYYRKGTYQTPEDKKNRELLAQKDGSDKVVQLLCPLERFLDT